MKNQTWWPWEKILNAIGDDGAVLQIRCVGTEHYVELAQPINREADWAKIVASSDKPILSIVYDRVEDGPQFTLMLTDN